MYGRATRKVTKLLTVVSIRPNNMWAELWRDLTTTEAHTLDATAKVIESRSSWAMPLNASLVGRETARTALVLLQLAACFLLVALVVSRWTSPDETFYAFLQRHFQKLRPVQNRGAHNMHDLFKIKKAKDSINSSPPPAVQWQAILPAATALRRMGSKSTRNLNLGNLGELRAKRRQEVFAMFFELRFGLEVTVACILLLAQWLHGREGLDWLFIVLWATAALALITSRGRRLLAYTEAKSKLKDVEEATMQLEGELPERIHDGTIRLVNVQWLLNHVRTLPTKEGIVRHQELPAEALLSPSAAHALLESGPGGAVAALTYGWLSEAHPDPSGFHLRVVTGWLAKHRHVQALFWDWLSCARFESPPNTACQPVFVL